MLCDCIDRTSEWVGKSAGVLVIALAGVMGYDVVARYAFRAPTQWGHETMLFLFGALSILGGASALLHKEHVNVDVLLKRLPTRGRAILDLITSTMFFMLCSVLLWKATEVAWSSVRILETSSLTPWEPPIWPVRVLMAAAVILLLLQGLVKFARDLGTAITGRTVK